MGVLKIYQDNYIDATIVSNRFIDEYMAEANDAQLKIYLYLLRSLNSGQAFSISGIADVFNHTEKDVIRALKYWEKCSVLTLEYDQAKSLVGIHLLDLSEPGKAVSQTAAPETSKPSYSLDQLKEFQAKDSTAQLLFIAEQYLGRPLTPADIKSILFFSDQLGFSDDLIDYLLQYCIERGKKDFRYMEKVAISWAEANVKTPADAEAKASRYDKTVYTIMNALGKNNAPTRREADYIRRWREEYGFETSIILEACDRTVLATDRHRFEYADKILSAWKEANVRQPEDISRLDQGFQKERPAKTVPLRSVDKYNRFMQNTYDFDALEQELLRK